MKYRTSREFYTLLKPEGLAKRKEEIHTKLELKYLINLLRGKKRILDVACGYGRFTIPLSKSGFELKGIDITPSLIRKARFDAKNAKQDIEFKIGDMRRLPYSDSIFDATICMWSAFDELAKVSDQIRAVGEMYRVLKKGGFSLIEVPLPERMTKDIVLGKDDFKFKIDKSNRIVYPIIDGIKAMPAYIHDKKSFIYLMHKLGIKKYTIFSDNFGGRDRFFLQFWKL